MKLSRKTAVIAGVGVVIIGLAIWQITRKSQEEEPRTVSVLRRTVTQDVSFTGAVQAQDTALLGFESVGTVSQVLAEVGEAVAAGQVLVRLDSRATSLELAKARADQASAQEELRLRFLNAEQDWNNTRAENARKVEQARQVVRDAKAKLDQAKEVWQQEVRESGDESVLAKSKFVLVLTDEAAYHAAQQALATAAKTAAKTNEDTRASADVAKEQYAATTQSAGNIAGLSSLEALEELAQVKLAKSVMTAPIAGTVTKLDVQPGQIITAGANIVTVETTDRLELVAQVTESDAAKINPHMEASITFDAYQDSERWLAKVTRVAPAAVIVEGVPTFEVTLELEASDERFKPGLTANIVVHAQEKQGVLAIPRRAVTSRDGQETVRVRQSDGTFTERSVTTGLVGSDGTIEITSGLSEGEQVATGSPATP